MNIAIFDVETTGLPQHHPYACIIEVAAVVLTPEGEAMSTFESLVKPMLRSQESEASAENIHHISEAMWRSAPSAPDVARHLKRWLVRRRVSQVTSYKTKFDFHPNLLGHALWLGNSGLTLVPCLKELSSERWGKGASMSLPEALAAANITPNAAWPAHTAMGDAVNAALLARLLLPALLEAKGTLLHMEDYPESRPYTRAEFHRQQAAGRVS